MNKNLYKQTQGMYMKDDLNKDFNDQTEFDKGMYFAAVQIIGMLENAKTKIYQNPFEEFWYINQDIIRDIKRTFGV